MREIFYRQLRQAEADSTARRALKLAEHVQDMVRHRMDAGSADVVHYQWLPVPALDGYLLPPDRPRVLTAHGVLRTEGLSAASNGACAAYSTAWTRSSPSPSTGAERLAPAGVDPERAHVIPHGAFDYLTRLPDEVPLPAELAAVEDP